MNKIANVFCNLSLQKPLGYPTAQISPAKSSSLTLRDTRRGTSDIARYAFSRLAFFGRNFDVCLSHYY